MSSDGRLSPIVARTSWMGCDSRRASGVSVTPTIYAEIEGHEAILALVALGCGVGVVPKLVLENSALRDRIAEIPIRPALPPFRVALCVRERALANPLVAAVWNA